MRRSTLAVCILITLGAGLTGAAPVVAAPAPSLRSILTNTRTLLRTQRFDEALQQLRRLKDPADRGAEYAHLEATAWLGKAVQRDLAATEAMDAIHLSGTVKHHLRSFLQEPTQAAFAKEVEEPVAVYLQRAAPLAATWPAQFADVLKSLERARVSARRAYELAPAPSPQRDEAAALWVWAELVEYVATREAQQAILRADTAAVFAPQIMDAIRKSLPDDRLPTTSEPRLRALLARFIPLAAESKSPTLCLALAECGFLYSAARDRLRSGRPGDQPRRLRDAAPQPPPAPVPELPSALLTAKGLEERINGAPETLILPLYQTAAQNERAPQALAASYGLYCALLFQHDDAAGRLLERLVKQQGGSVALLLEKARQALLRGDRMTAGTTVAAAFRGGALHRPVFTSLPKEIRPLWSASRPAARFAPQFLPSYRNLRVTDVPAPDGIRQLGKLRLAEALLHGNFIGDVADGLWVSDQALTRLRAAELPEEFRVRVEAHLRDRQQSTAVLPGALIQPQLKFSTFEMLPDGQKRPIRTLFISPSGLALFGDIPPGL